MKSGELDLWRVPPVKLAELARYGMSAHAPTLRRLAEPRRTATVLATLRHLEGASVDDALTLFDVLMATKLLARAEREEDKAELKGLPKLRKAAAKVASAVSVLLDVPIESEEDGEGESVPLSVAQAWERIEQLVTREELAKALVELGELLPAGADEDADTAWRKQLLERYATVRPFTSLLAKVIPWGATKAGAPIVEALRELPKVQARRKPGPEHIDASLLDGTWRRLVLGNPLLAVGYWILPGMSAASGLLVGQQGDIDLASDWGGGHVASADGMRFTVPLKSIHTRPNRKYFSTGRGARPGSTWSLTG
ncbi:Tn3 family transposase [Streptomyces avermitilis]|uniref:Tn3 family transposase n=1 Tax=Streptomyces avermitilis TaxID=33903 RepID=UPI0033F032EF